jgi:aspartate racemase
MKKIGIVGGLGWRSTMDYYEGLCRRGEEVHAAKGLPGVPSTPEMTIESLDLNKLFSLIGTDEDEESWSEFDEYHRAALHRLEACGAQVAAMAANSPHHRFGSITQGIGIPIVSIFEAAANECKRLGARQVLILATPLIMRSRRFPEVFAQHGIEAAAPVDDAARALTAELISDLQHGRDEGAQERLANIAWPAFERQFRGLPVVCLACTELPLALPQFKTQASFEFCGARYISTTAAHIEAIFTLANE